MQPHSKENVSSFPATKLDIRLVRNQLQLLVRVLGLLCWVAQCGRVEDKGAAGGLAEHDSGGAQADAGGGSTGAGRESAEGLGVEGVQAGGVLGGAADALRYGAGTRYGDRDSSARLSRGRGDGDGGWGGLEAMAGWAGAVVLAR